MPKKSVFQRLQISLPLASLMEQCGNKIQPSYMAVGLALQLAKYFVRIKISKNFCGIFGVEVMLHGVHPCICCFDLTIGMI